MWTPTRTAIVASPVTPVPTSPSGIPSPAQPFIDRLGGAMADAEPSGRVDVGRRPITAVLDRFVGPTIGRSAHDASAGIRLWWEGRSCSVIDAGPQSAIDAAGFLVTIHPDDDSRPDLDRRTASNGFDVGELERTILATVPGRCGPVITDHIHRRYRALLTPRPDLEPGRAYWLSVQALVPTSAIEWAWRASRSGDDGTSLRVVDGAIVGLVNHDRTFAFETVMAE